ncbi:hypothetical protein I7I51_03683 [Histoplasma capsulatum]|uniref:Uncharacterized protein n=1 Tax=Ajellomyces capsulatus TaxID=5037 RepID=A0A8A1M4V2_AJECA|nr:hypothetical protein I7I51_03683 [Histoplasma capsulatum]
MAVLYVAIYRPTDNKGTYHWALFLEDGQDLTISQAWGSPFSFKYDERKADPRNSKHHEENIFVAEIDDTQGYHETVRAQEINNELLSWGCQQWVLEALESSP